MGLLDFLKRIPTANEISGNLGELLTKAWLKTMPEGLILHDILIDGADGYTSQMDLVVIGGRGIYVVEVKLFDDARIYGDFKRQMWYYYRNGKKYELYSPVRQNEKHIAYLKKLLKDFGELPFFSVVTMICDDFKISGENDGKTMVCNSLRAMERGIGILCARYPIMIDDVKKRAIYEYIEEKQHSGKEARWEHKQNVIAYKEKLEEKRGQKICPYCKTALVLRKGKYGEFYGCSNYPKCRYTMKKSESGVNE